MEALPAHARPSRLVFTRFHERATDLFDTMEYGFEIGTTDAPSFA
jgi:hypothetical protein